MTRTEWGRNPNPKLQSFLPLRTLHLENDRLLSDRHLTILNSVCTLLGLQYLNPGLTMAWATHLPPAPQILQLYVGEERRAEIGVSALPNVPDFGFWMRALDGCRSIQS